MYETTITIKHTQSTASTYWDDIIDGDAWADAGIKSIKSKQCRGGERALEEREDYIIDQQIMLKRGK